MIHQLCPESLMGKRIIALDIESTGLSTTRNTIIELGVVEVENGRVKTQYKKTFGGGHSSMFLVRNVHHISDKERKGKKTFLQCAEKIADFLSNAIIVTHNGNAFDMPMIQYWLDKAGCSIRNSKYVDTLQLVRKMRKNENDEENEKTAAISGRNTLGNLCMEFNLQYGGEGGDNAHRGLEDAEACLDLLFYLVNANKVKVNV